MHKMNKILLIGDFIYMKEKKMNIFAYLFAITICIINIIPAFMVKSKIENINFFNQSVNIYNKTTIKKVENVPANIKYENLNVSLELSENDFNTISLMDEKREEVESLYSYKIKTKENSLPTSVRKDIPYAKFTCLELGVVRGSIYYNRSQSIVNKDDSIIGFEFGYFGGNKGEILGDHNYQYFENLEEIDMGTKIYIETDYGEFVYQATEVIRGWATLNGMRLSNGSDIAYRLENTSDIYLLTCSNSGYGNRYCVRCELIDGTKII